MKKLLVFICTLAFMGGIAQAQENMIKNNDFSEEFKGWNVVPGQTVTIDKEEVPEGVAQSLKVEVVTDGGKSLGQIRQDVKGKPGVSSYTFSGKMKSTKDGLGLLQIKTRAGRKELKRISVGSSTSEWQTFTKTIELLDGDNLVVHCRFRQSEARNWVGHAVWFADLKLTPAAE